jgi:hypothetical protein
MNKKALTESDNSSKFSTLAPISACCQRCVMYKHRRKPELAR